MERRRIIPSSRTRNALLISTIDIREAATERSIENIDKQSVAER